MIGLGFGFEISLCNLFFQLLLKHVIHSYGDSIYIAKLNITLLKQDVVIGHSDLTQYCMND